MAVKTERVVTCKFLIMCRICCEQCQVTHASVTSAAREFPDFGESSVPSRGYIQTSAIVKERAWWERFVKLLSGIKWFLQFRLLYLLSKSSSLNCSLSHSENNIVKYTVVSWMTCWRPCLLHFKFLISRNICRIFSSDLKLSGNLILKLVCSI